MQYLGYLVVIAAFYAGFRPMHPASILALALVSTIIFASARAKATKEDTRSLRPNPVLDGMYLFAGQALIMFTMYILGYFAASPAGAQFLEWLHLT